MLVETSVAVTADDAPIVVWIRGWTVSLIAFAFLPSCLPASLLKYHSTHQENWERNHVTPLSAVSCSQHFTVKLHASTFLTAQSDVNCTFTALHEARHAWGSAFLLYPEWCMWSAGQEWSEGVKSDTRHNVNTDSYWPWVTFLVFNLEKKKNLFDRPGGSLSDTKVTNQSGGSGAAVSQFIFADAATTACFHNSSMGTRSCNILSTVTEIQGRR